jgi:thermitase
MNNHSNQPNYPAACQTVMAVAATTSANILATFSNFGTWVDIAAPGVNIYTLKGTAAYANWSGTSLATPICAGVAALMIAVRPTITNSKICTLMKSTATPIAGQPFGRLNALAAIQAAQTA